MLYSSSRDTSLRLCFSGSAQTSGAGVVVGGGVVVAFVVVVGFGVVVAFFVVVGAFVVSFGASFSAFGVESSPVMHLTH